MKKMMLAVAVAFFGMVSAQKNTILVGGDVSYTSTTNKYGSSSNDLTTDSFEFNPTVGYQFSDHWTAGVRLGVSTSKSEENYLNTTVSVKSNAFRYGAFARYSMPLGGAFAAYGDFDVYGISGKVTTPYYNGASITYTDSKNSGFGLQFTPNLFINFKNSFGLNFNIGGIGYETLKNKDTDAKVNSFGFGFGKGVTVGISKNFGGK